MQRSVLNNSICNIIPQIRMCFQFINCGCIDIQFFYTIVANYQPAFYFLKSRIWQSVGFCQLINFIKSTQFFPESNDTCRQFTANARQGNKGSSIALFTSPGIIAYVGFS